MSTSTGHFYDNGKGGKYPSVTTIISAMTPEPDGITSWKKNNKNWPQILKYKATVGTLAHYRILKRYVTGVLPLPDISHDDLTDDIRQKAEIAEAMYSRLNPPIEMPYYTEYTVLSHKHKYAGQLDLSGLLPKPWMQPTGETGRYIFDLKTSNDVHDTYAMQLSAYRNAFEEMYPHSDIKGAAIINIHPFKEKNPTLQPKVTFFSLAHLDSEFEKFKSLASEYHNLHGH